MVFDILRLVHHNFFSSMFEFDVTKHLGFGIGIKRGKIDTMERVLFPESSFAHRLGKEESISEGGQVHGSLVGEEMSTRLQELVTGIDEALDLIIANKK